MAEEESVAALVRGAAGGNAAAWDSLVDRFTPLVWSICQRHRLSREDAADVCQNVWLKLSERLDTIREPEALWGWMATTTRRECFALFGKHRKEVPSSMDIDVPADRDDTDPDRAMLKLERREALLAALAGIPERGRTLLLLLVREPPISYREISERLDMPIGSIGPTRARYLARLRESPALAALAGEGIMTREGRPR